MNLVKAVVLILAGALLIAQPPLVYQIPIWGGPGVGYIWPRLSANFSVTGGVLDIKVPPAKVRVYGAVLAWDASAGGYPVPSGATGVAVFVNGLRYSSLDYTVKSGLIVPSTGGNWPVPSEALVIADYDSP